MYFWNIRQLAQELANNRISERKGMHYFLASTLLVLLATYYSLWWGVARTWLFYFELVVLIVIAVFGTLRAFAANGGDSGKSFVLRAICLSVPAGIRVNVLSIGFGLVLYFNAEQIFYSLSFGDPNRAFGIVTYAGFVGFSIYYWWLLVRGMRHVVGTQSAKSNS